jgi:hypothetical protein
MIKHSNKKLENLRTIILKGLEEKTRKGKHENKIEYSDIAKAFPGEPHQYSFEIKAINQKELKQWCSKYGFEVTFLKENVDPKYLETGIPPLLFRKITKT